MLEPWQALFVAVGLPGLLVALLDTDSAGTAPAPSGRQPGKRSIRSPRAWRFVRSREAAPMAILIGGYAVASLLWNGVDGLAAHAFSSAIFGWTLPHVGLVLGLALCWCSAPAGITLGGALGGQAARARRRHGRGSAHWYRCRRRCCCPAAWLLPFVPAPGWRRFWSAASCLFGSMPYGAAAASASRKSLPTSCAARCRPPICSGSTWRASAAARPWSRSSATASVPQRTGARAGALAHPDRDAPLPLGIVLLTLGLGPVPARGCSAPTSDDAKDFAMSLSHPDAWKRPIGLRTVTFTLPDTLNAITEATSGRTWKPCSTDLEARHGTRAR